MLRTHLIRLSLLAPLLLLVACSRPQTSTTALASSASISAPVAAPHAPANVQLSPNLAPGSATQQETQQEIADSSAADVRATPSRFELSALNLDVPVEKIGWSVRPDESGSVYSQWDEAAYAAGWHKNSALPGEGGNVVLSGHNNILGAVFRELDQLKRGDVATLVVDGKQYSYAVDKILILPEATATAEQRKINAEWIAPTDSERLTLVSCWPRDNNTHRIIVVAYPVN